MVVEVHPYDCKQLDAANPKVNPGLIPPLELDALVEQIHVNSNGESRQATGLAASNRDLYQVHSTFYDALGRNDRLYLLARAIQFFAPGVPQIHFTKGADKGLK